MCSPFSSWATHCLVILCAHLWICRLHDRTPTPSDQILKATQQMPDTHGCFYKVGVHFLGATITRDLTNWSGGCKKSFLRPAARFEDPKLHCQNPDHGRRKDKKRKAAPSRCLAHQWLNARLSFLLAWTTCTRNVGIRRLANHVL